MKNIGTYLKASEKISLKNAMFVIVANLIDSIKKRFDSILVADAVKEAYGLKDTYDQLKKQHPESTIKRELDFEMGRMLAMLKRKKITVSNVLFELDSLAKMLSN